jgi:hypothetical protein
MNRVEIFTKREPSPLAELEPALVKVHPAVRMAPTRYPFVLIFPPDEAGKATAAQRTRWLLKRLKREANCRVEWLPATSSERTEPTVASVEAPTPQKGGKREKTP